MTSREKLALWLTALRHDANIAELHGVRGS